METGRRKITTPIPVTSSTREEANVAHGVTNDATEGVRKRVEACSRSVIFPNTPYVKMRFESRRVQEEMMLKALAWAMPVSLALWILITLAMIKAARIA